MERRTLRMRIIYEDMVCHQETVNVVSQIQYVASNILNFL